MSIKRVSDLKKRSLQPDSRDNFQKVLDDAYEGGTELANSMMEISWNKNPSKVGKNYRDGDDNEFESQAITVHALSAGITDAIYNRDISMKGTKSIDGGLNLTGNVQINNGVDLIANQYQVDINGYNVLLSSRNDMVLTSGHDTIISSNNFTVIKGQTSVVIEIDNPNPDAPSEISLRDKECLWLSSGNSLSVIGNNEVHLIYGFGTNGKPDEKTSLTIWHRLQNGTLKPMLKFEGDEVSAYGKWHFPESYPDSTNAVIDGYINHAYYS